MKFQFLLKNLVILFILLSPSFILAGNFKKLNNGFVSEQGQFKTFENLKFFWQDEKVNIYFLTDKVVFITEEVTYEDNEESLKAKLEGNDNLALKLSAQTTVYRFDLEFINSNENVSVSGLNQMKHSNDYYLGHCPDGILNVPSFEKIKYTNIYDNIDLVFYFNDTILKYEFIINPGGNSNDITLNWEGVKDLNLVDNNVSFNIGSYSFTDLSPVSFDAEGNEVKTNYVLNDSYISFDIDTDDSESIQILDPGIVWASSLEYYGYGTWGEIVSNSKGDFYYVDWEWSPGGAEVTSYLADAGSSNTFGTDVTNNDIIISKFDQNGTLSWACKYGGSGDDDVNGGVAVDDNDDLYITGTTAKLFSSSSGNFPLQSWTGAFYQAWDGTLSTGTRGYLIKFLANNTRQWATYLDRGANLEVFDLECGPSNSMYMVGKSGSYPTRIKSGSIPTGSGYNGNLNGTTTATGFILQFNSSGALIWSTWLPGYTASTSTGRACDIAVDNSGNVYVAGDEMWSSTTRFSTSLISAGYTNQGSNDMFYMKFTSTHSTVASYGKYIGGAGFDKINVGSANGDIEADESGNLYLVGHTYSANFPVTNPGGCAYYDGTINDGSGISSNVASTQDGYLVKVSSSGTISYATFMGGTAYTSMKKIKCDSDGNIWGCGLQNYTGLSTISHTDYYNQTFLGTTGKVMFFQLRDDDYMEWLSYFGNSTGAYYYGGFDINEPSSDQVDLFIAGTFNSLSNVGAGYQYTSSTCTGVAKISNTISVHEPDGITPTMADACNISQLTVNGSLPSGTSWEWTSGSCGGTSEGSGTSISVAPSTSTTYYVQAVGTCFNSNCTSYTVNVYNSATAEGSWVGGYSTDWADCRNWGEGRVPDYTVDVIIPGGCTYYPNLTAGNFYVNYNSGSYKCHSLTIQSGGSVSTTTSSVDMHVYGNVTVQTGGTLSLYDDLDVHSGGNIYVTGGTITNNFNSGGYGDLFFRDGSGGYMTSGSITFYDEARWYENTTWYASGGTFHCGGTNDLVDIEIDDNSVYFYNFRVDAGVTAQLYGCAYELDVNGTCYLYGKMETDGYDADIENYTYIYSGGELEVNGAGTLWSTDGMYVGTSTSTEGLLDLNDGELQNDVTSIYIYGLVDMDGGTLDNNYYTYVYNGGQYLQNAGTMDTYYEMRIYDGTGTLVDFGGGTATIGSSTSDFCLRVGYGGTGTGETRITGGTVNTDHMQVYSVGLFNMTSGTLNITSALSYGGGYGGMDVYGTANVSAGIANIAADWEGWGGTSTFNGTADINITGHLYNRPTYNSVMNIQASADLTCGSIPNYQGTINQSGGIIHDNGYYYEQKENYAGGHFYGSGGTIEFLGTAYIDIDNDDTYFNDVIITGVRDLGDASDTYNEEMDVNGDLTINGTLDSDGRNIELAGHWTNSGTFVCGTNLVTFDGASAQNIYSGGTASTKKFYDVTCTNPGTVTMQNHMSVNRNFNVNSGTFLINNYDLYTIDAATGSASIASGAEVDLTGSSAYWRTANANNGNLTISGVLDLNDGKVTTGAGITLNSGGYIYQDGGSLGVGDNLTLNGTYHGNAGLLRGRSDSDNYAPNIIVNSTNVYVYNFFDDGGSDVNPTLLNGTQPLVVNNDVTINSGYFNANGKIIILKGDWSDVNGTHTHNSGTVRFEGISQQTVNSNSSFGNVLINNTGGILLSDDMTIDNTATFTSGIVNTNSHTVVFTSTASSNAGTSISYIDGPAQRTGTGTFTFALGDYTTRDIGFGSQLYSIWAPIVTNSGASSGTATIEYYFDNQYLNTWWYHDWTHESPLTHTTSREYWDVTSSADISVSLYWKNNNPCEIHDFCTPSTTNFLDEYLTVAYWDGIWKDAGGTPVGDYQNGYITSSSTIPFAAKGSHQVTFGGKDSQIPLPVELTYFKANCVDSDALLEWQTMSEINNDYFVLERSNGNDEFVEITRIDGAGNSNEPIEYKYFDENLYKGDNYYRLKQLDYDGKESVFEIINLNCSDNGLNEPRITAYPNPFINEITVNVENINGDLIELQIYDELGKLILSQKYKLNSNSFNTVLKLDDLKSAVYNLRCISNDVILNYKIIRK